MPPNNDEKQPSSGDGPAEPQMVLVTRSGDSSGRLISKLKGIGAQVIHHPVIEILALDEYSKLDHQISRLDGFKSIVFVSSNGVAHFLNRLGDTSRIRKLSLVAIGPTTSDNLKDAIGGEAQVFTPANANSESLAELMIRQRLDSYLIVRADRGSDVLGKLLTKAGITFEEVTAYQSRDIQSANPEVFALVESGQVEWITLTSSAIARSTIHLFGEAICRAKEQNPSSCKLVSISPITSRAIQKAGFAVDAEAEKSDASGIVAAIKNYNSL